jgi:DNA-binding response OmpR family regulator
MNRVLMVDDDEALCIELKEFLKQERFDLIYTSKGEEALKTALAGNICLVILNIHLLNVNGLELLRQLRNQSDLPVLILTTAADSEDRILGLEFGADDYLTKPFAKQDFLAHIRAILRRVKTLTPQVDSSAEPTLLSSGDICVDRNTWMVTVGGKAIHLTATEFNLLAFLLQEAGRIISREELVRSILGRSYDPLDRSIDVHISKLRRKIGLNENGVGRIKAIRGTGYCFLCRPHHRQASNLS